MNRLASLVFLTCVLAQPATTRGEMVTFGYMWNFADSPDLAAYGKGPINLSSQQSKDGTTLTVHHGTGYVSLTLAPGGLATATTGGGVPGLAVPALVPVGNLSATKDEGTPGTFTFSASFPLTVHLTDMASGESGDLFLSGWIYGNVSPTGVTLSAGAGTTDWWGPPLTLGGYAYMPGLTPDPGFVEIPGNGNIVPLALNLYVDGEGLEWPVGEALTEVTMTAPEPSTLALEGAGLALLVLSSRRRLQQLTSSAGSIVGRRRRHR